MPVSKVIIMFGSAEETLRAADEKVLAGLRVLLVDVDWPNPKIHKLLKGDNTAGFSHLLMGQARLHEVIHRTVNSNLCYIPAGSSPKFPVELLGSSRLTYFVLNIEHGPFDSVIFQVPRVLAQQSLLADYLPSLEQPSILKRITRMFMRLLGNRPAST